MSGEGGVNHGTTRESAPPSSKPRKPSVAPQTWATAVQISNRLAEAAVEDLRARYELGRLVHRLRYDSAEPHAMRAISKLAGACGLRVATLRRYARVTEMIRPVEFDELTRNRGPRGPSLTWSHIEELAEARNSEVRRKCAEAAVSEALSVSALRARVRTVSSEDGIAACQRGTIDEDALDER
jgi:hypothetical protein